MTVIRTSCPSCGDLELSPPDLHLQTYDRAHWNFYEFICPLCGELIQKPADAHIVTALRLGMVPETRTVLPEEALDPQRRVSAPLTYDDLLDFALQLGATDELAAQ